MQLTLAWIFCTPEYLDLENPIVLNIPDVPQKVRTRPKEGIGNMKHLLLKKTCGQEIFDNTFGFELAAVSK